MNDADLLKLCALARIDLSEEERESLTKDLTAVLNYVGKIQELELDLSDSAVQSFHTVEKNVFREDGEPHDPAEYSKALLEVAPEVKNSSVKVKKILS